MFRFSKGFQSHANRFQRVLLQSAKNSQVRTTVFAGTAIAYTAHITMKPAYCDVAAVPKVNKLVEVHEIAKEEVKTLWDNLKEKTTEAINNLSDALRYLQRLLTYMLFGAPLAALIPANYVFGERYPGLEDVTWTYLVWAAQMLGPCFVKAAQWASTRPDLFPPSLIEHLTKLQDDVHVDYPFSVVERTMMEAFGNDWKQHLTLDPKPLGAGSVAQVFQGTVRPGGEGTKGIKVAVKMIHPHVEKLIKTDMELLNMLARYIDKFESLEMLSLGDTVREFGDSMNAQMDLRREASHLVKFAKKFKDDKWAVFPQPVDGFVTKNVMVETLMDGIPINNFLALEDDGSGTTNKLKKQLSDLGVRLILKMIFFDNFIHGDLHPGNLLVQFDEKREPRLIVLDCGIVYSSVSDLEHQKLVDICFAFMQHNGYKAGQLMIEHASTHGLRTSDKDKKHEHDFCNAVQQIVLDSEKEAYFEHMGEYLGRLCDLARIHMVRFDPGYFKIAMALKVAEGIALGLDREIELVAKCVPIIVKARAMRKLGIYKFPEPEPDDEFINHSSLIQAAKSKVRK